MATPGISLLGFMDLPHAAKYLRTVCKPSDMSDSALEAEWKAAKATLGAPMARAGYPDIQPIPPAAQPYIASLQAQKHLVPLLSGPYAGTTFQMVEIDPLLAFQFHVDNARRTHHQNGSSTTIGLQEQLESSLQIHWQAENVFDYGQPNSVMIVSRGLNFRVHQQGVINTAEGVCVGVQVGPSIPWVHVTRFNGKCYLHNGFHRSVAARARGATHIPCLVRDVLSYSEAGIIGNEQTFDVALLESADPPTVGHYTQGRAYDVTLRSFTRTIHVSWSDYVVSQD